MGFQLPPVEYSTVTPETEFTPESASVIFAGFQVRVLALDHFQNSPAEAGLIQTSEATDGPVASLVKVA